MLTGNFRWIRARCPLHPFVAAKSQGWKSPNGKPFKYRTRKIYANFWSDKMGLSLRNNLYLFEVKIYFSASNWVNGFPINIVYIIYSATYIIYNTYIDTPTTVGLYHTIHPVTHSQCANGYMAGIWPGPRTMGMSIYYVHTLNTPSICASKLDF